MSTEEKNDRITCQLHFLVTNDGTIPTEQGKKHTPVNAQRRRNTRVLIDNGSEQQLPRKALVRR